MSGHLRWIRPKSSTSRSSPKTQPSRVRRRPTHFGSFLTQQIQHSSENFQALHQAADSTFTVGLDLSREEFGQGKDLDLNLHSVVDEDHLQIISFSTSSISEGTNVTSSSASEVKKQPVKDESTEDLSAKTLLEQNVHEQRYSCVICMEARLEMVWGTCQHRFCARCLYSREGCLRETMEKCPVCQFSQSFPFLKPEILEDNIMLQRALGVKSCSNEGCPVEMWEWEVEGHLSVCEYAAMPSSTNKPKKRAPKGKQAVPKKKDTPKRAAKTPAVKRCKKQLEPQRRSVRVRSGSSFQ